METIKNIIRAPLRAIGYDIVRTSKPNYTWLQELGICTLLDVGANVGQYAMETRAIFPHAQIYSFEPLKNCFQQLNTNMKGDMRFKAFNCALGEKSGEMQIHCNEHTPASSLLELTGVHRKHYPYAVATKPETIRSERLDDVAKHLNLEMPLMIKIDVQGFEDKVIAGGSETIRKAKILIIETTFKKLYEGQPLFDTIYEMLRELGFNYFGSDHQVRSSVDQRVLQENSVFIREC